MVEQDSDDNALPMRAGRSEENSINLCDRRVVQKSTIKSKPTGVTRLGNALVSQTLSGMTYGNPEV